MINSEVKLIFGLDSSSIVIDNMDSPLNLDSLFPIETNILVMKIELEK